MKELKEQNKILLESVQKTNEMLLNLTRSYEENEERSKDFFASQKTDYDRLSSWVENCQAIMSSQSTIDASPKQKKRSISSLEETVSNENAVDKKVITYYLFFSAIITHFPYYADYSKYTKGLRKVYYK